MASGTTRQNPHRLFLIDGPSLVYRAFYALPESIATSTGVPTNAIFGFASMLVKIITEYGVLPTVVAWDAGSSGRTELYAEYKAQRRSRPDLLKAQWPAMEPLVEAFGYRNVTVEGYEADDVIASLAQLAMQAEPAVPVMIVTGDRDAFQLIDDQGLISVMATSRGITDTKIYDRQAVVERYGIAPELIPDFYGLKGDTSDNIPGVPGIGEKTASELINRFGSLEQVLAHVEDISGAKRKQNLIEHAEDAKVSKLLATVSAMCLSSLTRVPSWYESLTAPACARRSVLTSCATLCAALKRRSPRTSWRCRSPIQGRARSPAGCGPALSPTFNRSARRSSASLSGPSSLQRTRCLPRGLPGALGSSARASSCWSAIARASQRWV